MMAIRIQGLTYEVVEDKLQPGDWRAEAVDYASEGECYVVIFCGPDAERRALEYAAWKNIIEDRRSFPLGVET